MEKNGIGEGGRQCYFIWGGQGRPAIWRQLSRDLNCLQFGGRTFQAEGIASANILQ